MKEKFTFWIPIVGVILLAAILVIQFKQQNHLNVLERQYSEIANTVQQQTAVMHRALGKIIPVELPELLTNRISDMEKKISNEKAWPKDIAESVEMRNELHDVLRQIPPWAEESILPRLNAMRWGVAALTLIAKSKVVSDDTIRDLFDEIDTALVAKPDGVPESVVKRLSGIQKSIKERFLKATIADAEKLVKKSGATPAEFSEAMERLSEWSGEEGVKKLLHDIRSRMLSDETSDFRKTIESNLTLADKESKESSVIIRQISRSRLLDSVISKRQSLQESHDADEKLIQSLTDLASRIEKAIQDEEKSQAAENVKKIREYQRWALLQIEMFNVEMKNSERSRYVGLKTEYDYQKIKDAMVKHLVPVSVGLLDSAVSRLYSEAFESGWKKLENTKHLQTEVAKQEALIPKKKP